MQPFSPNPDRLRVLVVSHAYNGPGRIGPFAALGRSVDLGLIGPREHPNGTLRPPGDTDGDVRIEVKPLRALNFGRSQFLLMGLRRALRTYRPDVVCIEYDPWHLIFLQVMLTLAGLRSHARVTLVVKKNTYRAATSVLGRSKRALSQWGVRKAGTIVAASEMARDVYVRELGAPTSKVVVQPHLAVDVSRFRPRERTAGSRPLRVGFVGKIGETKGIPELLTAYGEVRRRSVAPVELWLAGRLTDPTTRVSVLRAVGVRHVGEINNEDLHHFMADIDVFVMPARVLPDHQEHDGRAVLEAMSAGIPCVVSDSGILPELVQREVGRVFPAGDAGQLAECLMELAASAELRRDLGTRARERAVATVSPDVLSTERATIFRKMMEVT